MPGGGHRDVRWPLEAKIRARYEDRVSLRLGQEWRGLLRLCCFVEAFLQCIVLPHVFHFTILCRLLGASCPERPETVVFTRDLFHGG